MVRLCVLIQGFSDFMSLFPISKVPNDFWICFFFFFFYFSFLLLFILLSAVAFIAWWWLRLLNVRFPLVCIRTISTKFCYNNRDNDRETLVGWMQNSINYYLLYFRFSYSIYLTYTAVSVSLHCLLVISFTYFIYFFLLFLLLIAPVSLFLRNCWYTSEQEWFLFSLLFDFIWRKAIYSVMLMMSVYIYTLTLIHHFSLSI